MDTSDHDKQMTTDSGRQLAPQSQSSERQVSPWNDPTQALRPATTDEFRTELSGCLALVAPAGFDETARSEWLRAAWATLNGIPADLLKRGCRVARTYCDHPSKIVPTIMREVETAWNARKREAGPRPAEDAREPKRDYATPEQIAAIKAEFRIDELGQEPASKLAPIHIPQSVVKPVELADHEVPSVAGLSIAEIFAQRDRIRAAKISEEMADRPSAPLSEDEAEQIFGAM